MPRDPDSGMFAALHNRNYRLWASGQIVSLVGTWMQRIAQDWLVLTLSDGNALGGRHRHGPAVRADAVSVGVGWGARRPVRQASDPDLHAVGEAVCALVLGLLDVGGLVALWHVFLIAFALGCVSALDAPVRQSFTIEMVGKEHLSNAIALNSMTFNMARIVGPAISGVLINLIGTGWVFLLNVATFAGVLIALYLMNKKELFPSSNRRRAPKGRCATGSDMCGVARTFA